MHNRLFAADLEPDASSYLLEGAEVHHLRDVLRGRVGEHIELFNGRGFAVLAEIAEISRRTVAVRFLEARPVSDRPMPIVLGVCLPKGDRASVMVEKLTELGIAGIAPLRSDRSVTDASSAKLDKLRRASTEACKQCGRNWLLEISDPIEFSDWLADSSSHGWLLDPSGVPLAENNQRPRPPSRIAIGPEGGWTQSEIESARNLGWPIIRLSGHLLRIETAAIAIASYFRITLAPSDLNSKK